MAGHHFFFPLGPTTTTLKLVSSPELRTLRLMIFYIQITVSAIISKSNLDNVCNLINLFDFLLVRKLRSTGSIFYTFIQTPPSPAMAWFDPNNILSSQLKINLASSASQLKKATHTKILISIQKTSLLHSLGLKPTPTVNQPPMPNARNREC